MPRKARSISPTDYYHIMIRGNNREKVLNRDEQKRYFLELLKTQEDEELIDIAAYCIMDNHAHIIAKAVLSDLAKAMKVINIKYAMKYNHDLDRVGHVFQDRYKSEEIKDDKYLLQVIRYVHNNPVKAKMVGQAQEYNWSSYNEYINANEIISNKQKKFILKYFSNINQFESFNDERDNNEYLDTKEDIEKSRLEQGQTIISAYCKEKGIIDAKQFYHNPHFLDELIFDLLQNSKLSHRQIGSLLGVNNSLVHRVNMDSSK